MMCNDETQDKLQKGKIKGRNENEKLCVQGCM